MRTYVRTSVRTCVRTYVRTCDDWGVSVQSTAVLAYVRTYVLPVRIALHYSVLHCAYARTSTSTSTAYVRTASCTYCRSTSTSTEY